MKILIAALGIAATQLLATAALAQTPPTDKAEARAQRKVQGSEAAREFKPGEGNPIPDATSKVTGEERSAARQTRKIEGKEAAKEFKPGEGNPEPVASVRTPRAERVAARKARNAEVSKANKAGKLPSYGDNYGGK